MYREWYAFHLRRLFIQTVLGAVSCSAGSAQLVVFRLNTAV